ncbi:MAG: spore maturation protein [Eubacterium sp.]|nr:spore maturation protein [Eubacterium sp.]
MGIVILGLIRKEKVYEDFIRGAAEGLPTVLKVMPTLIGLMVSVGMLRASGFMEFLGTCLGQWTEQIGFPGELMPLTIVKIFSSSAATGMLIDLYKSQGVDSYISNVASIMMSSTETVFYTMSVYFLVANVTKTRWTLMGAMIATIAGTMASMFLATGM